MFLNYEYPPIGGGGGTASKFLAQELVRLGHDVEVVTAAYGSLPKRFRMGSYRITRLLCLRSMAGQCKPHEMISWVLSATLSLMTRWGEKPDAMVSFHSIPSGLVGLPMSIFWQRPHLTYFAGGDVPGWLPGELEKMHRRTLWLNRLVVYQAASAFGNSIGLSELAQKSFPKKEIKILYYGVDTKVFTPPKGVRKDRAGKEVRFFFAGRMTTQKGFDTLLKALGLVNQLGYRNWKLYAAGFGPKLEEFKALAREVGVAEQVVFLGFQERLQVRDQYRLADVYLFPSRYEGMSNTVLEAMSCGLPVIGTPIAGSDELIEEGVTGYKVPVDDEKALAKKIYSLSTNRELQRSMGREARRRCLEQWTWRQRAQELSNMIEEVISER